MLHAHFSKDHNVLFCRKFTTQNRLEDCDAQLANTVFPVLSQYIQNHKTTDIVCHKKERTEANPNLWQLLRDESIDFDFRQTFRD